MRLQKFLADAGIGSRRKCEELISAGLVRVNGETAQLGASVRPEIDLVEFDGKIVKAEQERVVLMLNKPRGVICTASDPQGRPTVMEYFRDLPYRIYNIGRLDYDSEGLLLFTNDGELAYRLTHPKFMVRKTYYAVTDGELTHEQKRALETGIPLEDGVTAPAEIRGVKTTRNGKTAFTITIREGKNREIRRMLSALGHETLLLRRLSMGPVKMGDLERGSWRFLTEDELRQLDHYFDRA